jgi:hypothetical protein
MLKQVQHDMTVRFWSFCYPEPGPELDSGSIDFGISVLGLENLGFKAPPCGRGSLLVGWKVSGDSARVRVSAPGADITPKLGVYQHQVMM